MSARILECFLDIGFALYVVLMTIVIGYLSNKGKSSGKGYLQEVDNYRLFLIFATMAATVDQNRLINLCNGQWI